MSYKNNNSLSDNLEIDMLRTMIAVVTVILCFISIDGNPYIDGFSLWMYFVALAPVIFIFTFFMKKFPKESLVILVMFLVVVGVILRKDLIYNASEFLVDRLIFVMIHFVAIVSSFWKVSRTLLQEDVEADISMYNNFDGAASNSRKLTRRRNRRANSRAKNSVKIKSGQYRG